MKKMFKVEEIELPASLMTDARKRKVYHVLEMRTLARCDSLEDANEILDALRLAQK
jgi:hypothetical protein